MRKLEIVLVALLVPTLGIGVIACGDEKTSPPILTSTPVSKATPTPAVVPTPPPPPTPTPNVTPTPALTPTPTPTSATTPTPSPSPTAAPEPTLMSTPTPASLPLFLDIVEPEDWSVASAGAILVSGNTIPTALVSAFLNGEISIADVGGDGSFSFTLSLEEGPNFIEVIASDLEGNEKYTAITVVYIP